MLWLLGALFMVWALAVWFFGAYRIWIFYYSLGAGGLACWLALASQRLLGLDLLLASSLASTISWLAPLLPIDTSTFTAAPGTLMVLVVEQGVQGWTVFRIGVESSGLLELCALAGLLSFYPGWALRWRLLALAGGLALTWLANLARILLMVLMLQWFGKQALVLAHTYVGKGLFFVLTVALYWYLVTVVTLGQVRRRLRRAEGGQP